MEGKEPSCIIRMNTMKMKILEMIASKAVIVMMVVFRKIMAIFIIDLIMCAPIKNDKWK